MDGNGSGPPNFQMQGFDPTGGGGNGGMQMVGGNPGGPGGGYGGIMVPSGHPAHANHY